MVDDPRREVAQRDRVVVLIERAQATMLRDRASAGSRVVVTGSAAPEAASAARRQRWRWCSDKRFGAARGLGLGIERPTPKVAISPYLTVKELGAS